MKIDHLGIATKGIDEALKFWADASASRTSHTEIVEDQKVCVAMLPIGESRIELLEPTSEDSPISKFLEKRRRRHPSHCCRGRRYRVALKQLKSKGVRLIDEAPRVGAEVAWSRSFTRRPPAACCSN